MINQMLNSELICLMFTVILVLGVIFLSIYSQKGRKKLRKLQKYYANVKSIDFLSSTNHGPDPCENDAEIEDYEICSMSEDMLLSKKGSI